MAVGTFNPNPPFAILDQGGVGNWWQLPTFLWEVRQPDYALARYSWGGTRTHTVEIFGKGFVFFESPVLGPSAAPLRAGTITAYHEAWDGIPLWMFTGFSLTSSELRQFAGYHDPYYGLEHYVLRGADTISGTDGDNSISGREGDDELHGRAGNDWLRGNQGGDRLFGEAGNDSMEGGDGHDLADGGPGNDLAHGGGGTDVFLTGALLRQAQVRTLDTATVLSGPEGVDTLTAFERIAFVDGILHLDPAGAAGQVWRLYGAAFKRDAEATGFANWVAALDTGATTLADAAQGFVGSAEFNARYGLPDDAGFVSKLYANVLGRAPDATGLEAWIAQLDRGVPRAEVLLGFSESAEYRACTAASTGRLWAVDQEALDVLRAYMTVLDRKPDAGGLASWTAARNGGLLNADMLDSFIDSAEFQGRFGALSNEDFVSRMYLVALDRPADAPGHAAWTSTLHGGALARRDVVQGFAYSEELTQKLLPLVADGIAFA